MGQQVVGRLPAGCIHLCMQKLVTQGLLFCISRFAVEGKLRTNSLKETLDQKRKNHHGHGRCACIPNDLSNTYVQDIDIYMQGK